MKSFREYVVEGSVTKVFAGYTFKFNSGKITMYSKDKKELASAEYPSLTSVQMKKIIKEYEANVNEVADTFRVRSMVRDVIETIKKNDGGIESLKEMTKAVMQKHKTFGNDVQASRELESWGKKDMTSFIENIIKTEYLNEAIKLNDASKKGIDKLYKVYAKDASGDMAKLHSIIRSRFVNNQYTRVSNQEIDYIWSLYKKEK